MQSRKWLAGLATVAACVAGALPAWGQSGLEAAFEAREDFSGVGNIAMLNNGLIVVSTGGGVYTDPHGELVYEPLETIVLPTPGARAIDEPLFVMLKLEDAEFDLEWGELVTLTAVTETENSTRVIRLELRHPGLMSDADVALADLISCTAKCGPNNELECNLTCPAGKASLAYCDGNNPVCQCVSKPQAEP